MAPLFKEVDLSGFVQSCMDAHPVCYVLNETSSHFGGQIYIGMPVTFHIYLCFHISELNIDTVMGLDIIAWQALGASVSL